MKLHLPKQLFTALLAAITLAATPAVWAESTIYTITALRSDSQDAAHAKYVLTTKDENGNYVYGSTSVGPNSWNSAKPIVSGSNVIRFIQTDDITNKNLIYTFDCWKIGGLIVEADGYTVTGSGSGALDRRPFDLNAGTYAIGGSFGVNTTETNLNFSGTQTWNIASEKTLQLDTTKKIVIGGDYESSSPTATVTFSGGTTIFNANTEVKDGSTLIAGEQSKLVFNGTLSNSGNITIQSGSALSISSAITNSGSISTVGGGKIVISDLLSYAGSAYTSLSDINNGFATYSSVQVINNTGEGSLGTGGVNVQIQGTDYVTTTGAVENVQDLRNYWINEGTVTVGGENATTGAASAAAYVLQGGSLNVDAGQVTLARMTSDAALNLAENTEAYLSSLLPTGGTTLNVSGTGRFSVGFAPSTGHGQTLNLGTEFNGTLAIREGWMQLQGFSLGERAVIELISGQHWSDGNSNIAYGILLAAESKESAYVFRNSGTATLSGKVTGNYLNVGTSVTDNGTLVLANSENEIGCITVGSASTSMGLTIAENLKVGQITSVNAASTITINAGKQLTISGNADNKDAVSTIAKLSAGADSVIKLEADAVLNKITSVTGTVTVTGNGTYVMGNSVTANLTGWTNSEDWTGTVELNGMSGTAGFLHNLGNAKSTIKLSGVSGWINAGNLDAALVLENGDNDFGLKIINGVSSASYNFGKISGSGDLEYNLVGSNNQNFYFSKDISGWKADESNTEEIPEIRVSSSNTLHVFLGGDANNVNVAFTRESGTLNLTVNTAATFSENVTVSSLTLNKSATFNKQLTATQITMTTGNTLELAGDADYSLSAAIAGRGSLIKDGAGSITLTGAVANAFENLKVEKGTLTLASGIGQQKVTAATIEGKMIVNQGDAINYNGSGTISVSGGTLELNTRQSVDSENRFSLTNGTISGTGGEYNPGSVVEYIVGLEIYDGSRMEIESSGNSLISTGIGLRNTAGTVAFAVTDGTLSVSGGIAGYGGIEKSGAGTLTLSGANTFGGTTSITAGKLVLQESGSLSSSSISIADGAIFEIAITTDTTTLNTVSGAGQLLHSGSSTTTITRAENLAGGINVTGGTLNITTLNGDTALEVSADALLNITNWNNIATTQVISGSTEDITIGNISLDLANFSLTSIGESEQSRTLDKNDTSQNSTNGFLVTKGKYYLFEGIGLADKEVTGFGVTQAEQVDGKWYTTVTNQTGSVSDVFAVVESATYASAGILGDVEAQIAAEQTLTLDIAEAQTLNAALTGEGAFIKSGEGKLTLGKTISNSGGVTINAGEMVVDSSSKLNVSSVVVEENAILTYTSVGSSETAKVSGAGTLKLATGNRVMGIRNIVSGSIGKLLIAGEGTIYEITSSTNQPDYLHKAQQIEVADGATFGDRLTNYTLGSSAINLSIAGDGSGTAGEADAAALALGRECDYGNNVKVGYNVSLADDATIWVADKGKNNAAITGYLNEKLTGAGHTMTKTGAGELVLEKGADNASLHVAAGSLKLRGTTTSEEVTMANGTSLKLDAAATITGKDSSDATMSKVQMSSSGISGTAQDGTKGSISAAEIEVLAADASFTIADMTLTNTSISITAAETTTRVNLSNVSVAAGSVATLAKGAFAVQNQATVGTGGGEVDFTTSSYSGFTLGSAESAASITLNLGDLSQVKPMGPRVYESITILLEDFHMTEGNASILFAADSWLGQLLSSQGANAYVSGSLDAPASVSEGGSGSSVSVSYSAATGDNVGTIITITGLNVPEPTTSTLSLLALAALAARRRRK